MKYKFISPSKVKLFALEFAKANRAQKFTRVSSTFLDGIEAATRAAISSRIMGLPSKGKTLQ